MSAWLAGLLALPLIAQPITFNRAIAPIVFQICASCHRPDEAEPFPLLSYEDVKRHASQIVAMTGQRYMPAWPPEPGYGDFEEVRRLSDGQIRRMARWVENGPPEGDPADLPPAPHFISILAVAAGMAAARRMVVGTARSGRTNSARVHAASERPTIFSATSSFRSSLNKHNTSPPLSSVPATNGSCITPT